MNFPVLLHVDGDVVLINILLEKFSSIELPYSAFEVIGFFVSKQYKISGAILFQPISFLFVPITLELYCNFIDCIS